MKPRFDFSSKTTGRTYLKAMFDTPSEGFTAALSLKIRNKLVHTARELENMIAVDSGKTISVRLTMDNYEACVFWYIVLFRPFFAEQDPVLGTTRWSVHELMTDPSRRYILKRLDWGVYWDEERNWLVLLWEEALTGVLEGMRKECTSWNDVVSKEEKRLGRRLDWTWWKKCAESISSVIPVWKLQEIAYMKGQLWHRPGAQYKHITVLDVAGIDIPKFQVGNSVSAVLPEAKRAHFAHHYVEAADKRTYMASIEKFEKEDVKAKRKVCRGADAAFAARLRNKRRREQRQTARESPDGQMARVLSQISSALGKAYRRGRPPRTMAPEESDARFTHTVNAYINGDIPDPNWPLVERLLNEVETLLNENHEIRELRVSRRWLLWRNHGNPGILAFVEHRRGNLSEYNEILKSQPAQKRNLLRELVEVLQVERE